MKSILFRRLSLFLLALQGILLLSFSSCDKKNGEDPQPTIDSIKQVHGEEEESDNLPEHYFRANLHGIDWVADSCFFSYTNVTKQDTMVVYFWTQSDTVHINLILDIPVATLGDQCLQETEYPFSPAPHNLNMIFLQKRDPNTGGLMGYSEVKRGRTIITNCNYTNKTLSGVFEYSLLPNMGGDTIRITNGQFRVPLNKDWNWFD